MALIRRWLLVGVAAIFYVLGWLAGSIVLVVVWCLTALRLGWTDGRRKAGEHGAT